MERLSGLTITKFKVELFTARIAVIVASVVVLMGANS